MSEAEIRRRFQVIDKMYKDSSIPREQIEYLNNLAGGTFIIESEMKGPGGLCSRTYGVRQWHPGCQADCSIRNAYSSQPITVRLQKSLVGTYEVHIGYGDGGTRYVLQRRDGGQVHMPVWLEGTTISSPQQCPTFVIFEEKARKDIGGQEKSKDLWEHRDDVQIDYRICEPCIFLDYLEPPSEDEIKEWRKESRDIWESRADWDPDYWENWTPDYLDNVTLT